MKKNINTSTKPGKLRKKAEELYSKKVADKSEMQKIIPEADANRLIHELEVHQIELELQNQELIQAIEKEKITADKYTQLYDFAPCGYLTLSNDSTILEANLRAAQLLGNERSPIINSQFNLFVSDATKIVFDQFLHEAFLSGSKTNCIITLTGKDKKPNYIHLSGYVLEDSDCCNLILVDISDWVLAENALNESQKNAINLQQAHLRLIDFATDHNVKELLQKFLDETEILTHSEVGFYNFVGNDQETISLQTCSSNTLNSLSKLPYLDHRQYPVSQAGIWVECVRQLKPVIHNDYLSATGRKGLPEGHVSVIRELVVPVIRNGKVVAILGVGNKKTNYNQSDVKAVQRLADVAWEIVERKRAEEALIKSENHARALIDAIPDMMFRMDKHGIFIDFEAATDQLYYKDSTIIGKKCLEILPPQVAAQTIEKISLALETGEMQVYEYQLTIPGKSPSDFEVRMVPASSNEVVTIVRDITVERKNAHELLIMNQKLKNANAEKDKFFSIIAHDLKSPFNVFLGATELIKTEFDVLSSEQIQSLIGSLHGSAKKLYELLENLLEWSRMQRGVFPYEPSEILLPDFVENTLELSIEMAGRKNISCEIHIPAGIKVYADAKMLNSLLRNLASNAVKFTNPGGRIVIAAQKMSNNLTEISISDNGIGIPPETIDKLFSLAENISRPGTLGEPSVGLGLLLCNEFARWHGSELYVESEEGKGSKFSFRVSRDGIEK